MKIDIIIPNFNGAKLIEKNLPFVYKSIEKYNGKIIIIDDGSNEEDRVHLRNIVRKFSDKNILLHERGKNGGFSTAVNTGVSLSSAEFIVLLNSDVAPRENFLENPLRKLNEDKMLFAVGCMDESIEGDKIVKRGRGVAGWRKGMLHHKKGETNKSNTFWVSGGSGIFRRSIYKELGGLDELYNPFYWEDIDLSYRAQKAGYKIIFDSTSIVKHYHDEGAIKSNFSNNKITVTAYRNQFIFIWKNITSGRLMFDHFIYLPLNILNALKGMDLNFIKGIFLAMQLLPAIIEKRQKQKRLYKVSDIEVINRFHE